VQGQHLNDWASSPDLPDVWRVGQTFQWSRPSPDLPDVWRVGLVLELLARPAGRLAGRACPAAPRPTCRTSGGSGLSWSSSPDLPDVWRVGLVLQLLVRPAGCLAGRVCPATPCKTCRTSGGSGLSRAPCPTSGHPAGRAWSSSPTWSGGSGQG
jgi:hypothetical protein